MCYEMRYLTSVCRNKTGYNINMTFLKEMKNPK